MLNWALVFFIIAIIAALFGFTGIAAGAATIAKWLFFIAVAIFVIFLILGLMTGEAVSWRPVPAALFVPGSSRNQGARSSSLSSRRLACRGRFNPSCTAFPRIADCDRRKRRASLRTGTPSSQSFLRTTTSWSFQGRDSNIRMSFGSVCVAARMNANEAASPAA